MEPSPEDSPASRIRRSLRRITWALLLDLAALSVVLARLTTRFLTSPRDPGHLIRDAWVFGLPTWVLAGVAALLFLTAYATLYRERAALGSDHARNMARSLPLLAGGVVGVVLSLMAPFVVLPFLPADATLATLWAFTRAHLLLAIAGRGAGGVLLPLLLYLLVAALVSPQARLRLRVALLLAVGVTLVGVAVSVPSVLAATPPSVSAAPVRSAFSSSAKSPLAEFLGDLARALANLAAVSLYWSVYRSVRLRSGGEPGAGP